MSCELVPEAGALVLAVPILGPSISFTAAAEAATTSINAIIGSKMPRLSLRCPDFSSNAFHLLDPASYHVGQNLRDLRKNNHFTHNLRFFDSGTLHNFRYGSRYTMSIPHIPQSFQHHYPARNPRLTAFMELF